MAAGLFDVLKDMFAGDDLSRKYSDKELKNLGFIIQRTMSIKYPLQAQSQNVLGVNMCHVVKYWAHNMKGKYKYMPKWAMTSTAKMRQEYQARVGGIKLPDKEVCAEFMSIHALDDHEFKFLMEHKPKELSDMLNQFEQNYRI